MGLSFIDIRKSTRWILNNAKEGNFCKSPPVTDEDLSSTTRLGDPEFELNDDFEDVSELGNEGFGSDVSDEDEDENFGEMINISSEEIN